MTILPENKPMEKDITPKVFFIWGQSMHGKTYLARQFPNPIILNTDGNGKKINTPHVEITDFETFVSALKEIESGKHTYETIVIDLIDDIKTFLETFVCEKYKIENLADAPFGKAFNDVKSTWKRLMIRLTQVPYNIVVISHIIQVTDEYDKSTQIDQPSLEQKFLNMTKGRTDVMIKCQKIGKNYLQICNERRDTYKKADFKNDAILKAVENVKQLFDDNKPIVQSVENGKPKKQLVKKVVVEEVKLEPTTKIKTKIETTAVETPLKEMAKQVAIKKSLLIKKEEE